MIFRYLLFGIIWAFVSLYVFIGLHILCVYTYTYVFDACVYMYMCMYMAIYTYIGTSTAVTPYTPFALRNFRVCIHGTHG